MSVEFQSISRRYATTLRLQGRAGRSSVAGSSSGNPTASATCPAPGCTHRAGPTAPPLDFRDREQEGKARAARDGAGPACAPGGAPVRNRVLGAADSVSVVTSDNVLMSSDPGVWVGDNRGCAAFQERSGPAQLLYNPRSYLPRPSEVVFCLWGSQSLIAFDQINQRSMGWAYMDNVTCFCIFSFKTKVPENTL